VDDQALGGDAALAGRLEGRHHGRVNCDIEIRLFGDDDRILAAHLTGDALAGDAAELVLDVMADLGGTGEKDGLDVVVLDDGVAGVAEP